MIETDTAQKNSRRLTAPSIDIGDIVILIVAIGMMIDFVENGTVNESLIAFVGFGVGKHVSASKQSHSPKDSLGDG